MPRAGRRSVLLVASVLVTTSAVVQCSTQQPPQCDQLRCSSPDGQGGVDCWATMLLDEPCSCGSGGFPHLTGQTFELAPYGTFLEYQCCDAPGAVQPHSCGLHEGPAVEERDGWRYTRNGTTCGAHDPAAATTGVYGDAEHGAAAFAHLVAVACEGDCRANAARWGGALQGEWADAHRSAARCAAACAATPACDVWSFTAAAAAAAASAVCELKAAAGVGPALRPSVAAAASTLVGGAACQRPWLPFPDGLAGLGELPKVCQEGGACSTCEAGNTCGVGGLCDVLGCAAAASPSALCAQLCSSCAADCEECAGVCPPPETDTDGCFREGYTYGDQATGACADSDVVAVLAANPVLNAGVAQRWWSEAEAAAGGYMAFDRFHSPHACQSRCAELPLCGGFTFLLLSGERDADPVCVLKQAVACDDGNGGGGGGGGAFGGHGLVAGSWAGTRSGCVGAAPSPPSHPFFQQTDTPRPRCTRPHSSGEWLTGARGHFTFVPDDDDDDGEAGCFFHPLSPAQLLPCMAGRWQLVSGGSNAILSTLVLANLVEADVLHISRDGVRTGASDFIDLVWGANGTRLWRRTLAWAAMGADEQVCG